MPLTTPAIASPSLPATATRQFAPPPEPMLLTRKLRRPLSGNAEIVTWRSYEVRFRREDAGYRVEGELVDVLVEAPRGLEALATLERNRPDTGLFPMWLDSHGMLVAGNSPQVSDAVQEASVTVAQRLGALPLDLFAERQAQAFVSGLKKHGAHTPWPDDLFQPSPGRRQETRTIPLPNGVSGRVSVITDAEVLGNSGLLASLSRVVTSQLEDATQVTEELWTLSPILGTW